MPQITLKEWVEQFSEFQPIIMREFIKSQVEELSQGKITPQQFLTMEALNKQKESKMKDLAQCLGVSMATMTGIIDRLVKHGYAERSFDENDRRIIKANLTTKGSSLFSRIKDKRRKFFSYIFGQISAEDRDNYLRIINKIREVLSKDKANKDE